MQILIGLGCAVEWHIYSLSLILKVNTVTLGNCSAKA